MKTRREFLKAAAMAAAGMRGRVGRHRSSDARQAACRARCEDHSRA